MMQPIAKPKKKVDYKKRAWDNFSLYVRTDQICRFHQRIQEKGLLAPCHCGGVFQACHKITRANGTLLYDMRNIFCGCSGSNVWANNHQVEWDRLWRKMWPEDEEYLDSRKHLKTQRKQWDYKIIADEYKKKLEELEKK